jgi:hypothetical protein
MQSVSSNAVATTLQGYATTSALNTALLGKAKRIYKLLTTNSYVDTSNTNSGNVTICILSQGSLVGVYALYEHGTSQKRLLCGSDFESKNYVQFSYISYGVWRITAKVGYLGCVLIESS